MSASLGGWTDKSGNRRFALHYDVRLPAGFLRGLTARELDLLHEDLMEEAQYQAANDSLWKGEAYHRVADRVYREITARREATHDAPR